MACGNPKDVAIGDKTQPSPPVVTCCLKMKTVVNPKTHKQEIVALSGLLNTSVNLDGDTGFNTKTQTHVTLVRPLGTAAGTGSMPAFPHDLDQELKANFPDLKKCANERFLLSQFFAKLGNWDPDVIVGHACWSFDLDVILARAQELKVPAFDKIGRLRRIPDNSNNRKFGNGKEYLIEEITAGRGKWFLST